LSSYNRTKFSGTMMAIMTMTFLKTEFPEDGLYIAISSLVEYIEKK